MSVKIKYIALSKEDKKETFRELFCLAQRTNRKLADQIAKAQEAYRIYVGVGSCTDEILDEVLREELNYDK